MIMWTDLIGPIKCGQFSAIKEGASLSFEFARTWKKKVKLKI